jgi:photosystem II stability/assembly factor-like uncharacterized protein
MGVQLFVGTAKGLFIIESDADRRDWEVTGPHHKGWQVYSVLADTRTQPTTLWAGLSSAVYGPHLRRSTDGGATWTQIEHGPRFPDSAGRKLQQIWTIAPGATPGSFLAGVAHAALFGSADGGSTWALNTGLESHPTRPDWNPGAGGLCLHAIIPDPVQPQRTFVGISAVGVFRTDDGGQTWAVKNTGVQPTIPDEAPKYTEINRCVHGLVQDPRAPNVLYQQNHIGVFRTSDGGDHWERIEAGLSSRFGFPIAMHPRDSRTLYLVPQESDEFRMFPDGRVAVYRTRNGGDSWHRLDRGLDGPNYGGVLRKALAVDALEPAGVYFGTTGGEVFASAGEGDSWRRLPVSLPRVLTVHAVTI